MLLDGEKLPDLDEVDLETIFNQVRTEDLENPGLHGRCSLVPFISLSALATQAPLRLSRVKHGVGRGQTVHS